MQELRHNEAATEMILEEAIAFSQGELEGRHPMVLSCGGVFVPRPRRLTKNSPLYRVLHTASNASSVKLVSNLENHDILATVLNGTSLN